MARKPRVDESREPGGYCALPWCVIDSQAYQSLSYPAAKLLIELARQYVRNNNGRLLLSMRYLTTRGWRSGALIDRCKRELLDAKLIYQTVQGHRPNKASWYALTWYSLDKLPGYDAGAVEGFRRGMYSTFQPSTPAPTREALFEKWRGHGESAAPKINMLTPAAGLERAVIAPAAGLETSPPSPAHGAIRGVFDTPPSPAHGNHLDKPFCTAESLSAGLVDSVAASPTTTAQTADNDDDIDGGQIERVRERDLNPANYDPDTGEFFKAPTAPARKQKQAADRWVKSKLAAH
jgi:hypothetical protein